MTEHVCPYCGSTDTVKVKVLEQNEKFTPKDWWFCKFCREDFVPDPQPLTDSGETNGHPATE